jgi:hypothetical protein
MVAIMRYLVIVFILISVNLFGQHKLFVAIQDDRGTEISEGVKVLLSSEDNFLVVDNRADSDYILRVVVKESPAGVSSAVVITEPLEQNRFLPEHFQKQQMDGILYQSCIVTKSKNENTAMIYSETVRIIQKDLQEFREWAGN